MTPLDDNKVIYVFKLQLDSGDIYLSTKDITLNNFCDGKVLEFTQYNETFQDGEIDYNGGISILGTVNLIIASGVSNTNFSEWFNEFYPNTSVYLINRYVSIGIVWEGATLNSQITWLHELKIIKYNFADNFIELGLDTNNEFTNVNIPYFKIQDVYDDGISYKTKFYTDENNQIIPAIYGNFYSPFNNLAYPWLIPLFAKTILFDKVLLEFVYAYHPCYSDQSNNYLFKYIAGAKNFLIMKADTTIKKNSYKGASIQLNPITRSFGEVIVGDLYINNIINSESSNVSDVSNLLNTDDDDYILIPVGQQLAVKIDGSISTSETGMLSPLLSTTFKLLFVAQSDTNVIGDLETYYHTDRGNDTATSHSPSLIKSTFTDNFGTSNTNKPNASLPWTVEEICNIEYILQNTGTQAIRIYLVSIILSDIHIQQKFSNINVTVKR